MLEDIIGRAASEQTDFIVIVGPEGPIGAVVVALNGSDQELVELMHAAMRRAVN